MLQVLAIQFVALAIEFVTLAIESITLALEFIRNKIGSWRTQKQDLRSSCYKILFRYDCSKQLFTR